MAESFCFTPENPGAQRAGGSKGRSDQKLNPRIRIAAHQKVTLAESKRSGILRQLWFTGYVGNNFILRAYFDGIKTIEGPLPSFFGFPFAEHFEDLNGNYPFMNSIYLMVAPGRGFNAFFMMPFQNNMRIEIENCGEEDHSLYYALSGTYEEINDSFHFYASFRHCLNIPGEAYPALKLDGKGRFLGVSLAAIIKKPYDCWVEGEVKMYFGLDLYPSINYTGTEDYFGASYAFGKDKFLKHYQEYSGLYMGLSAVYEEADRDLFQLYRFHEKDPIYFEDGFTLTFDNMDLKGGRSDEYFSVCYYYQ